MDKTKVLLTTQALVTGTTGVVVGTIAALAIIGVASSITGKILGGLCSYALASTMAEKASETITNPIVGLLITEEDEN